MRITILIPIGLLLTLAGCSQNQTARQPLADPAPARTPAATAAPNSARPTAPTTPPRTTTAQPAPQSAAPAPARVPASVSNATPPQPQTPSAKPLPATTEAAPADPPATPPDEAAKETPPDEPAEETSRLPRYLKVLEQRSGSAAVLPEARTEGARTVRIRSNDATALRITRTGLPLTARGSLVLRIDEQVFEWTPQHRTLDLGFSPSSGWSIIATDGNPK